MGVCLAKALWRGLGSAVEVLHSAVQWVLVPGAWVGRGGLPPLGLVWLDWIHVVQRGVWAAVDSVLWSEGRVAQPMWEGPNPQGLGRPPRATLKHWAVTHGLGAEGVLPLAVWGRLVLAMGDRFAKALWWGLDSVLQWVFAAPSPAAGPRLRSVVDVLLPRPCSGA